MKKLLLPCLISFLAACTSLKTGTHNALSFNSIKKLTCGQDSEESVSSALGAPDKKIPMPESKEALWIYNDRKDGYSRVSMLFDEHKKLQSVTWLVREEEPEIQLEVSQRIFPEAKFVAEDAPWENPHSAPDQRFYSDEQKGVSITFRKARQEVESIGWYNANLKTSGERKPAVKYEL